ncbi:MAG: protein-L-isoaspartate(D-aspartate) O-methyltransferase [Anaerolineaceae bacterium]|nr:protein-L-isoaspartate(D-aspartate) O-methyltransferase [Anaerolineaceae bacterium]
MKDLTLDREKMVRNQIERRGIKHLGILAAMRQVPRHLFVSMEYQSQAYADHPLPIGYNQTISQPYIVALMSELIQPQADDCVLEVGSGSGYQAAILSLLVSKVHSIDRHPGLVNQAQAVIDTLKINNVLFHVGDGSLGLPEFAPFDAILITAAAPKLPRPLLDQLKIGGRLVLPVGERWHQTLERWTKTSEDTFEHDQDIPVSFVPLVGKFGWSDSDG